MVGVSALIGGSGLYFKCKYYECCNDRREKGESSRWIRYDENTFHLLDRDLREKVHGQPLVRNLVVRALQSHFEDDNPLKPLVLSFHGWTGGGKNFVSDIIVERLYKKGKDSDFVQRISGTERFPDPNRVNEYKIELRNIVTGNVSRCGRQLFVIDEVDKIPKGVIDGLKPFLDYKDNVNGVDYRKAVFIFLSNTGGKDITSITYNFLQEGKERDDITLKDIEPLINLGAFNEKGGLRGSDVIEKNLIDYYVPFLPLERKHVKSCVEDFVRRRYKRNIHNDELFLDAVADEMEYFPPDTKIFSVTGCKKVHTKVPLIMRKLNRSFN
ncbi:torsin-1A-like protein [Dinothrombium tinctorium]|uniref:Torsin-1A-like protein n=1 Tax=Dinothrombium tinctorium TaxID=1965070 RepID=A0A443R3N7_9ACAR|nr:torsin-1A-like protein [Dinothrombium tinctorium]